MPSLLIIPHSDFGAKCSGCVYVVEREAGEHRCDECGAVIPPEDVQRVVTDMGPPDVT
jgi:hypothetical protein